MAMNFTNETMDEIIMDVSNSSTLPAMTYPEYIDMIVNISKGILKFQVGWWINRSMYWVLTAVAVICNTLSLVTITQISPFTSSSLYISVMAVCDTLTLALRLLIQQLDIWNVNAGDFGCGIMLWSASVFQHLSIWIIVAMTIERFVAVWYPFRVTALFSLTRTKLSILILFVVFAALNIHHIWTYYPFDTGTVYFGIYCRARAEVREYITMYWYWVNAVVFSLAPCPILLILNVLIIFRMRTSFKKQKEMVHENSSTKDAQQRQITVMLLSISFSYIIFFLPVTGFNLFDSVANPFASPEIFSEHYLVNKLVYMFSAMSHAANFFFYFGSSKKFRFVVFQILRCQSVKKEAYRSKQTGSTSVMTVSAASSSRQ